MALTAKKVYAILKRQISDMEAKLNSPVRYRGTVATADLLPLNPDIGDMYNIESKSIYGEAGMNVAWNGVVWDTMGAPIDMSLYLTKEESETVIQRLVTEYFEKNPVKPGATTEQAQQIEQNKTDIASLKTETGSLKEDLSNKITKFYASSQGETHLADSDNGKIMDMMVYGKSEQKQYSGKNLFDFHQLKPKNPNITTVTTTEDAIIVSSNAQTFTGAVKIYEECDAFKGKTITISANIVKADNFDAIINFGCGLFYENAWHWKLQKVTDLGARYITVIVPETITKIQFLLNTNDTNVAKANTITVSEYMVEYGSEPTTYEPYTGGIPSPNPDYPQEIKSVVNPTVKVCGKNLLNATLQTTTRNGVTCTANGDGTYTLNGTATERAEFIIDVFNIDISKKYKLIAFTKERSYINCFVQLNQSPWTIYGTSTDSQVTITDSKNIRLVIAVIKGTTLSNENIKPMIVDASLYPDATYDDFEPYHEQTVTFPYTLNAIPVSSGGNVTIDGQQYIADYVDVERGKVVKRVKVLNISNLDKSKWGFRTDTSVAIGHSTRYYGTSSMLDFDTNINAMSNIAIYGGIGHDAQGTFRLVDAETYLYQFNLDKTKFDKVQDFTDYLASNNVYIQYALKVPQELDLKPEEIVLFKSLSANYPTTNISINSEQLDGYTVFNYPISMQNGWNYVKQQIGDTREYIYDMDARAQDTDLQAAEAYVNSEYAVALTELEV